MYYKIVELRSNGNYYTLFHGINGSRHLKQNKWLSAEIKPDVHDGGVRYESGWHFLDSWETACEYLKRFSNRRGNLIITPCEARGRIRRKPTKGSRVLLADQIKILNVK